MNRLQVANKLGFSFTASLFTHMCTKLQLLACFNRFLCRRFELPLDFSADWQAYISMGSTRKTHLFEKIMSKAQEKAIYVSIFPFQLRVYRHSQTKTKEIV
jgi:hypothetical protein